MGQREVPALITSLFFYLIQSPYGTDHSHPPPFAYVSTTFFQSKQPPQLFPPPFLQAIIKRLLTAVNRACTMAFRIDIHAKTRYSETEELKHSIAKLEKRLASEKLRLESLVGSAASTSTSTPAARQAVDASKKQKGGKAAPKVNKTDDDKLVLDNAEMGKVVTRFPPEASGFMHIGHAKAALSNFLLAQKYKGRMVFRFDDTNPVKENPEFEREILEDTAKLGVTFEKVTYTSDRFEEMLAYCDKLIADGNAYVDDTEKEELKKLRWDGLASKRRDQSIETNKQWWEEMKAGTRKECVVRAKISVDDDNKCMRDPTMYRSVDAPHCRTGNKYKVYPTYDFACPIVDSLDGVTHALRTSEYNDRNPQFFWVCDALGLRKPNIQDFSRLNMEFTVMSKRKLTKFVDSGIVDGWNDPRFPTVKGILRRGLTVDALKIFIIAQGMSRTNNFQEWGKLWNANKDVIDPDQGSKCRRYTCVSRDANVAIDITDAPALEKKTKLWHAKNPELGDRQNYTYGKKVLMEEEDLVLVKDDEEVTLMSWGNVIFQGVKRSADKLRVEGGSAKHHPEGSVKKTQKLTWLADCPENKVPIQLVEYDYLVKVTKPDLSGDDVRPEELNKDSKAVTEVYGEEACKQIKKGDTVQFERRGYYICDSVNPLGMFVYGFC